MSKQHLIIRKVGERNLTRVLSTISAYTISIVLAGLGMLLAPASHAATSQLRYLTIAPTVASGTIIPSGKTFNLPGYGSVKVIFSPTALPSCTSCGYLSSSEGAKPFYSGGYSAGFYTWGANPQDIGVYNGNPPPNTSYTVTFQFIARSGRSYVPPDPKALVLVIAGLRTGTTATVKQAVYKAGELTLKTTGASSPTVFVPPGPTGTVIGSGYVSGTDPANTGWALFQTAGMAAITTVGRIPTLTVSFSQVSTDGIGFTLGYASNPPDPCCPPWNPDIMLSQLQLSQPGNITSPITYYFLNSEPPGSTGEAQMQGYIDYLHSLNPSITSIVLEWGVSDCGASGPGTSPGTCTPIPPNVFTEWSCTGCSSINNTGILGGSGRLTNTSASPPYPLSGALPVDRWYEISTFIYLNDGIEFWGSSCATTSIVSTVYAGDPMIAAAAPSTSPNQIAVHVIRPGETTGSIMMLPRTGGGQ